MEVQAFLLVDRFDAPTRTCRGPGLVRFLPAGGAFPAAVACHYFMVVRRAGAGPAAAGEIRLRVIDADGPPIPGRNDFRLPVRFAEGTRFCEVYGQIGLQIARPGMYRIDLSDTSGDAASLYSYDFDVG